MHRFEQLDKIPDSAHKIKPLDEDAAFQNLDKNLDKLDASTKSGLLWPR